MIQRISVYDTRASGIGYYEDKEFSNFFKATEFSQILFSIKPACYLVRKYYQNLNNLFSLIFKRSLFKGVGGADPCRVCQAGTKAQSSVGNKPGMVVHGCDLSTQVVQMGRSVQGHPQMCSRYRPVWDTHSISEINKQG